MTAKNEAPELQAGNVKEAMKGVKSGDLWQVPYEDLYIIPGFNVREHDDDYEAHIESITGSIVENGYDRTKPLSGYVVIIDGRSRVAVTDGHTRYIATGRARERGREVETLPVVTATRGTSVEDLTVGLVTSNSGKALKPYEIGTVCKRLIQAGWSEADIARRLGITATYVNDLLFLHEQPKSIQDMVKKGQISATLAIETARKHGPKAVKILQDALSTAKEKGKKKASAKDVAPSFKKEVKKAAPSLYASLKEITQDSAFKKLHPAVQETAKNLLASLPEEDEE